MNEDEFHKRIKEILAINHGKNDSSAQEIHQFFSNEVKSRSVKDWDNTVAAQVIREFEWATNTQPKRDELAEDEIKSMLGEFLSERGYKLSVIKEGTNKTPDCYIENDKQRYICEIKSPILNLDHATGTFKFKTSHTKLLNFIHTAAKQFKEQDPDHKLPWILVFSSSHFQLNWKTFVDATQGGVIDQKGNRLPDFSNTPAYTSAQLLIRDIDVYIWFQANARGKKFYQVSYFLNGKSTHINEVVELVKNLSHKSLSSMDNKISINNPRGKPRGMVGMKGDYCQSVSCRSLKFLPWFFT